MSENAMTDREKIIQLIENLSDANVQRILIYIQGLQAGQNLVEQKGAWVLWKLKKQKKWKTLAKS